ncbi:MAG: primase C-terminal domain-containing protein [Flavobacteriales bacterium]|nr:primase C-terminal domain-containing protein [Flavobacteriales bacterium]
MWCWCADYHGGRDDTGQRTHWLHQHAGDVRKPHYTERSMRNLCLRRNRGLHRDHRQRRTVHTGVWLRHHLQ